MIGPRKKEKEGMRRKNLAIITSLCVVSAIALTVAAVVHGAGNQNGAVQTLAKTGPEIQAEKMINELPAPSDIDPFDEVTARTVFETIKAIYDLERQIPAGLTVEQETVINEVIEAYCPSDEIAKMETIPVSGGVLSSGSYALKEDLELNGLDITIPTGADVVIELNGHKLIGTGQSSVITVESGSTLTLKDSSFYPAFRTGAVAGGTGSEHSGSALTVGGGACVSGTFYMLGGTVKDCTADSGGGIYVPDGRFRMSGGTIEGCTAAVNGGGVYVGLDGAFEMTGGVLKNCSALNNGGGIYSNCKMSEITGTVYGCSAAANGGGIYILNGTVLLGEGAAVENCFAAGMMLYTDGTEKSIPWDGGGGVFAAPDGTLRMNGGMIAGCATEAFGGGVFSYGRIIYTKGDITGCSASGGGGILVADGGELAMNGGTITGCRAKNGNGGGVNCSEGTVKLEGTPIITGNNKVSVTGETSSNLYLPNGKLILLSGDMTEGASVGISTPPFKGEDMQITETETDTSFYASAVQYLISDTNGIDVISDICSGCVLLRDG